MAWKSRVVTWLDGGDGDVVPVLTSLAYDGEIDLAALVDATIRRCRLPL